MFWSHVNCHIWICGPEISEIRIFLGHPVVRECLKGQRGRPLLGLRGSYDEILVGNFHSKRHQESGRSCSVALSKSPSVFLGGGGHLVGFVDYFVVLMEDRSAIQKRSRE